MNERYKNIINLPRHVSPNHPQMSRLDRAAQFAPYAALTGYDGAIRETARLTNREIELDEYEIERLDRQLWEIRNSKEIISAAITYFIPDRKKQGGSYVTVCCEIEKIDEYSGSVILTDGQKIDIKKIINIETT